MAEDKNTLELISDITEFNDLHEFMKDEHLDRALAIVVKLLMNPDVPSAKAPHLIMELQAMSTLCFYGRYNRTIIEYIYVKASNRAMCFLLLWIITVALR